MPAKNTVKPYQPNAYYHIYNYGIADAKIFQNNEDYQAFLDFLQSSLTPIDAATQYQILNNREASAEEKAQAAQNLRLKNFAGRINLLCYVLMPNEYHLLVHQNEEQDIAKWMQSFMTRFTMQINKRQNRSGALFKGVYRATVVHEPLPLLYLTRLFHRLPLTLWHEGDQRSWGEVIRSQPSSYPNYLGEQTADWLHPEEILKALEQTGVASYLEFIEYNRPDLDQTQNQLLVY